MVDVVFVLMLFFMASAGAQVVTKELNINLPAGAGTPNPSVTPIVIEIDSAGVVMANNKTYGQATDHGLSSLGDFLKDLISSVGSKDPVIIRPSPDARHERIIDVLNCAKASGVTNLTFS